MTTDRIYSGTKVRHRRSIFANSLICDPTYLQHHNICPITLSRQRVRRFKAAVVTALGPLRRLRAWQVTPCSTSDRLVRVHREQLPVRTWVQSSDLPRLFGQPRIRIPLICSTPTPSTTITIDHRLYHTARPPPKIFCSTPHQISFAIRSNGRRPEVFRHVHCRRSIKWQGITRNIHIRGPLSEFRRIFTPLRVAHNDRSPWRIARRLRLSDLLCDPLTLPDSLSAPNQQIRLLFRYVHDLSPLVVPFFTLDRRTRLHRGFQSSRPNLFPSPLSPPQITQRRPPTSVDVLPTARGVEPKAAKSLRLGQVASDVRHRLINSSLAILVPSACAVAW